MSIKDVKTGFVPGAGISILHRCVARFNVSNNIEQMMMQFTKLAVVYALKKRLMLFLP
jgi:hypothetical protein